MTFLIWSIEHDAWWRADRIGYTRELAQAGRYPAREAIAIVEAANRHRPVSFECWIPLACCVTVEPADG